MRQVKEGIRNERRGNLRSEETTEAHRGHKLAHAFCKMKKQKSKIHLLYFNIHILKLVFFFITAVCELQYKKRKAINTFCVYKYQSKKKK
jgi:hypothetical protein